MDSSGSPAKLSAAIKSINVSCGLKTFAESILLSLAATWPSFLCGNIHVSHQYADADADADADHDHDHGGYDGHGGDDDDADDHGSLLCEENFTPEKFLPSCSFWYHGDS